MTAAAVMAGAGFLALQVWLLHAGSRDYDEGVYWQSIRAMVRGEPLFRSVFASLPPGFYYALLPFYLVSHSLVALRIGVVCFALGGIAATYAVGRMLAGPAAGIVALLLLAGSPLYIQRAAIVQGDMPAVAMMMVALAIMIPATRGPGKRTTVLAAVAGLAFAAALGLKFLAVVAVVPLLVCLLLPRRQPIRVIFSVLAGTAAGLVVVLLPCLRAPAAAYDDLFASHLVAGQATHLGPADNLAQLLRMPEAPLAALALAGAVIAVRRKDPRVIAPLGWLVTATIAVLAYQPLFPHHLLLLPPAMALTASVGFANLATWQPRLAPVGVTSALLASAIGLALGVRDAQHALLPNGHGPGLAAHVRAVSAPSDFVISDNPFAVALADRDMPGPLVDTSHERTTAGLLTVADLDAARLNYSVKVVLIDGDRLRSVPGFSDWLAAHYRLVGTVGRNAFLYTALQDSD